MRTILALLGFALLLVGGSYLYQIITHKQIIPDVLDISKEAQ